MDSATILKMLKTSDEYFGHCCNILRAITVSDYEVYVSDIGPNLLCNRNAVRIFYEKDYRDGEIYIDIPLKDFLRTDYDLLKEEYKAAKTEREAEVVRLKIEAEKRRLEEYNRSKAIKEEAKNKAIAMAYLQNNTAWAKDFMETLQ